MESSPFPPIVIAFGEDDFLRSRCLEHAAKLGAIEPIALRKFEGDELDWRELNDELSTRSLFDSDGTKGALVRRGDKFLTSSRDKIEKWIEREEPGSTLFLELKSLPANQRLYGITRDQGLLINCNNPSGDKEKNPSPRLEAWILHWAEQEHKLRLTDRQAAVVSDRIGFVIGLIDSELAKLALYADEKGKVSDARVSELVGGWRTETVWKLTDDVAEGRIADAIEGIDKLILAGQEPIGIAAQLSWSLRRYGVIAERIEQWERYNKRRIGLEEIGSEVIKSGFRPYEVETAKKRLIRIGRPRAKQILGWLLDLDFQLKDSHSKRDRARLALEKFIFRFQDLDSKPTKSLSNK